MSPATIEAMLGLARGHYAILESVYGSPLSLDGSDSDYRGWATMKDYQNLLGIISALQTQLMAQSEEIAGLRAQTQPPATQKEQKP